MAWARNGTPNTLGSAGDDIDIIDLTAYKFNIFLHHQIKTGNCQGNWTFNNNSNSVYANRWSANGGADGTATSATYFDSNRGITNFADILGVMYLCSISGEEKLAIYPMCWGGLTGAGNAPERIEFVMKFVPSPDADITRVDINNNQTGSFDTGSNLTALNGDTTESLVLGNIQSGSRMEVTDTRKIYYWNGSTFTEEA